MTKDIPVYKITIDPEYSDGEDLGIEQIAFTSQPAVITKGLAFNENKRLFFSDDLKYRVVAPAMIPMQIYRKDDEDGEYYVSFDQTTIEQIHSKFMSDLSNRDVFNLEHDTSKTVPAYVLEAWIVEDPKKDKAYSSYGIEVPEGTLMITAQVTDKDYYNELVNNEQIGFSIEGFLGLKLRNQLNKINMNRKIKMNALPDGEHLIDGKTYVVVGGVITEIRDAAMKGKAKMNNLPDGEHLIDGKTYVVVGGVITEIRDVAMKGKRKMNNLLDGEHIIDGKTYVVVDGVITEIRDAAMKGKTKMNNLPDGEHTIDGKIYVVVGGVITEIRDVEITANEDEVKEEEIALEETVVEEEELEEEEEKLAVDPAVDADAILAIVQPLLTDHENKLLALIADLRNRIEEMIAEDEEVVEVEDTKLSSHQAFSKVSKFLNNNN
jgi:hypothetical protein